MLLFTCRYVFITYSSCRIAKKNSCLIQFYYSYITIQFFHPILLQMHLYQYLFSTMSEMLVMTIMHCITWTGNYQIYDTMSNS